MEVTTQEGAEAPEETPVTQPPGESPESPEPAAPPQPGEAPAEPPEPEQKPEPEADPEEDAGEAKAKPRPKAAKKPKGLPENATRAGRAKGAKAARAAKADSKPVDKEKEEQKKLGAEYTELNKKFRDKGADVSGQMARRMRHLAKKLDKTVPKWAEAKGSQKDPDAPKRADDPDLKIAHEMTAYATNGKIVDGKVVVGDVKFGANVSARQVGLMREALKGKDILKTLKVSETKLAQYAAGKIKATDLPEEARAAIKELNTKFDPSLKMWARKDAVIALFLHRERRAKGKKSAKAEQKPEAVAA